MANLKISELPYSPNIDNSYEFAVVNTNTSPIETQKVTITGMTWQGGAEYIDALAPTYTPAAPFTINTTGTSLYLTGFTQQTKRYEANTIVSVTITWKPDAPNDDSFIYIDVDSGSTTPNFYLPETSGAIWRTASFTWRAPNLSAGSHSVDLYINTGSATNFEIGQIILSFQEL